MSFSRGAGRGSCQYMGANVDISGAAEQTHGDLVDGKDSYGVGSRRK
jgi:hypothetical protein